MPNNNQSSYLVIAENRKARHNYYLEEHLEAGLVLAGWEVKSLRAGRAQLAESYILIKKQEAWLIGAHISPLTEASSHIIADPVRSRKLLLKSKELQRLVGAVQRKGYTLVPLNLHWHDGKIKLDIALGKGKKIYDKRETLKKRDWERQKQVAYSKKKGG